MAILEMELDRLAFLGMLYKAQGVVDRKSTINVLSHLLVEPSADGSVHVTGTDYDVVLEAKLAAQITQSGSAAINGKSLFEVIKSLDTPNVHIKTLDNHWVEVTACRSRFKLAGISADDFPAISTPSDVTWLGISKAIFKDLIELSLIHI